MFRSVYLPSSEVVAPAFPPTTMTRESASGWLDSLVTRPVMVPWATAERPAKRTMRPTSPGTANLLQRARYIVRLLLGDRKEQLTWEARALSRATRPRPGIGKSR